MRLLLLPAGLIWLFALSLIMVLAGEWRVFRLLPCTPALDDPDKYHLRYFPVRLSGMALPHYLAECHSPLCSKYLFCIPSVRGRLGLCLAVLGEAVFTVAKTQGHAMKTARHLNM